MIIKNRLEDVLLETLFIYLKQCQAMLYDGQQYRLSIDTAKTISYD